MWFPDEAALFYLYKELVIDMYDYDKFIKRIEDAGIELHSLLVWKKGRLEFEEYFTAKAGKDKLHRMFSCTIGLLVEDGRIETDDLIADYFPEFVTHDINPLVAEMTIEDLLSMRTCYRKTTYDATSKVKNWVESFFISEPDHKAGTVFNYDTSASHVLAALIEKISGKELLDFLRERFLNEIGFSEDAYIIKDPFGVSMGGAGLYAKSTDLLKTGQLFLADGMSHSGNEIFPSSWLHEMTVNRVSTKPNQKEAQGYGYQLWIIPNGYAFYGLGGQWLMIFPEAETIVVTTADNRGNKFLDWEIMLGAQELIKSIFS